MDDLVDRATSEALTAEDWSLIISICEQAEGYYLTKLRSATKAKETVQALTRRIAHKNVNVVLYSLTLANALVQNCSLTTKQQIASRDFLKELQRILASKCHVIVKDRILDFIKSWAEEMKDERSLDYMGEVYRGLLSEGAAFPKNQPPSPKKFTAKDREEEDLQLAMAMSLSSRAASDKVPSNEQSRQTAPVVLFQVTVLYDFNPTEEGELQLKKSDLVDVLDNTTFPDWWKGSLEGKIGIFPANYVSKAINERSPARPIAPIDENQEILQHLQSILDLKTDISRADPLGHNQAEIEKLQNAYQKAVDLVPIVLQRANAQRRKQGTHFVTSDDLAMLHDRFSKACATYQGIMNTYQSQVQASYSIRQPPQPSNPNPYYPQQSPQPHPQQSQYPPQQPYQPY